MLPSSKNPLPLINIQTMVLDYAKDLYLYEDQTPNENWPTPATSHSAGLDLRIAEDLELHPGESKMIGTGLRIWIQKPNVAGLVMPRSSTGGKLRVVLSNGTGVIDADYQGELKLILTNQNPVMKVAPPVRGPDVDPAEVVAAQMQEEANQVNYWYRPLREVNPDNGYRKFQRGDRVAQILFVPVYTACLFPIDEFTHDTTRGIGGLGSTGTN